ncbi:hypothetical protein ACUTAF_08225 [Pseudomonas sp. SP16.1]|uniref:hypothetical protein n=1 Tax=Pseudomonas sp. SP16.1 TaxID=3458854 RepID=UPI004045A8B6
MSQPRITLGGVEIVLHAGAPVETLEPIGGSTVLRMSDGAGIKQQHWERMAGSISGDGWMPPGLDGLDYSGPLELRSTKVQSIGGSGLVYTLTSTPRPDVAPWGLALVGRDWVKTACAVVDGVATLTAVAGATAYRACWLPVFSVFANRPSESQSGATGGHTWSLTWEEA